MQAALCDGKVVAETCMRFLQDVPSVSTTGHPRLTPAPFAEQKAWLIASSLTLSHVGNRQTSVLVTYLIFTSLVLLLCLPYHHQVQAAAAEALALMCHGHPPSASAVLSTKRALPHILTTVAAYDRHPTTAQAAVSLLDELTSALPTHLTPLLLSPQLPHTIQPPTHITGTPLSILLTSADSCSRASISPGVSTARSSSLLALLQQVVGLLWTAASCGGTALCRELGRAEGGGGGGGGGGVRLLLELARRHRGVAAPGDERGLFEEHAAVVRDALGVLELVMAQVG